MEDRDGILWIRAASKESAKEQSGKSNEIRKYFLAWQEMPDMVFFKSAGKGEVDWGNDVDAKSKGAAKTEPQTKFVQGLAEQDHVYLVN